jgi:transcription antitermination factor NusA-like protein
MKESDLKEKLGLLEKELVTLSDKLDSVDNVKDAITDIQKEIKGLKLFLSRVHPEFKKQFPELIKKLKD